MNMLRGADRVNVEDGWLGFSSILDDDDSAFTTLGFKLPILSGSSEDNESLDVFMCSFPLFIGLQFPAVGVL